MTHPGLIGKYFILSAFDRELWCPVLQARFEVADRNALRAVLGEQADDDPELQHSYCLDEAELAAVIAAFGIRFDPAPLGHAEPEISLYRQHSIQTVPYLVHTDYELPLLLGGRKKLAKMYEAYPPMTFDGEERFDHWVTQGKLHREEVLEPFETPHEKYQGIRTVYYTPKGEEWRIPAMRLIWRASQRSGGWNEYFERLEGMLLGYDDWQNDWWIGTGLRRGGFGGRAVCCAVTEAGLAWMESAGFRALPPCDERAMAVRFYDDNNPAAMRAFLLEQPDSVALVRFVVAMRQVNDLLPPAQGAVGWQVPSDRIPELNRLLRNAVVVAMRRDVEPEHTAMRG